jgi:hypothetical protein
MLSVFHLIPNASPALGRRQLVHAVHGEVQQDRGERVRQPVVDVEEEAVVQMRLPVRKQRPVLMRLGL